MKHSAMIWTAATAALLCGACGGNDEAWVAKLRQAVDQSDITMAESLAVAEGVPYRAAIVPDRALWSVRAEAATQELKRYHVAYDGELMDEAVLGAGTAPCPGGISLLEAVNIAEAHQGGEAVAIEVEDEADEEDEGCMYEVQVLTASELWEVELSPAGAVVETELSDEDGSGQDDD